MATNLRKCKRKKTATGNFDELPEEILESIFECLWRPRKNIILGATVDFIRISAVCKTWQRASSRVKNKQLGVVGPLIFLAPYGKRHRLSRLLDFSSDKTQHLQLPRTLDRCFINSWSEWLVTVENRNLLNRNLVHSDYQVHFYNMFSGAYIQLPQSSALQGYNRALTLMIKKAIASCAPSDLNCVIMAIPYDTFKLAYCKIGAQNWEILINKSNLDKFVDLIYFKDEFYAVTEHGNLFICDLKCVNPKMVPCLDLVYKERGHNYLVEICGDLFRIVRLFFPRDGVVPFIVYKMDFIRHEWQVVNSFGEGRSIFIGTNMSICISANGLPIQSDCIYFNDSYYEFGSSTKGIGNGMGIFDMKTKFVGPIFPPSRLWSASSFWITKV